MLGTVRANKDIRENRYPFLRAPEISFAHTEPGVRVDKSGGAREGRGFPVGPAAFRKKARKTRPLSATDTWWEGGNAIRFVRSKSNRSLHVIKRVTG